MSIKSRLAKLEASAGVDDGWEPFTPPEPGNDDWEVRIETTLGWPVGTISRTAHEAAAKGYQSVTDEIAHLLGVPVQEYLAWLKERSDAYEARHEWKWVDGKCYIRERRSGLEW